MKFGIISDTHDQIEKIKEAIAIFNNLEVDIVYHLGDWCSPFVLHLFSELNCPVKGVFGNNDADIFKHIKFKPDNVTFHDRFFVDTVKGKKIAVMHGDPVERAMTLFKSGEYDVLLRGHDHVAQIKKNNNTTMINPGNLVGPFSDITENWTKPSIAIYELNKDKAEIIQL